MAEVGILKGEKLTWDGPVEEITSHQTCTPILLDVALDIFGIHDHNAA